MVAFQPVCYICSWLGDFFLRKQLCDLNFRAIVEPPPLLPRAVFRELAMEAVAFRSLRQADAGDLSRAEPGFVHPKV